MSRARIEVLLLFTAATSVAACSLLTNLDGLTCDANCGSEGGAESDARTDGALGSDAGGTGSGDGGDAGCNCPPGTQCTAPGTCFVSTEPQCTAPVDLGRGGLFVGSLCDDAGRRVYSCDDASASHPSVAFLFGSNLSGNGYDVRLTGSSTFFAVPVDSTCTTETSGCATFANGGSVGATYPNHSKLTVGLVGAGCADYRINVKVNP